MKKQVLNYTAVFQKEPEGGYTVYIPILPGCVSYGKDLDEAKRMIQEALQLYLESMSDHKEEMPTGTLAAILRESRISRDDFISA